MLTSESTAPMLPGLDKISERDRSTRWFSQIGCVVREGDDWQVFVAGTLVMGFETGDKFSRNVVLVSLADSGVHLGKLARAFELSEQRLRMLRKKYAEGGAAALQARLNPPPRSKPRLNRRQIRSIEREFEKGKRPAHIVEWVDGKFGVKRSTVYAIHREWRARKAAEGKGAPAESGEDEPAQQEMPLVEPEPEPEPASAEQGQIHEHEHDGATGPREATDNQEADETNATEDGDDEDVVVEVADAPLKARATQNVQHAGTWLLMAVVMQLGLYEAVLGAAKAKRISIKGVRAILDAVIAAFSIGERSVEGVRRIETPTADVLLRAKSAPSAPWVRTVLGRVAKAYATIQERMIRNYLAIAAASDLAVFYVDNHLRPYTGKFTLRKGWRMQDKRAVPGTSDYYVHDVDGRPVLRETEPSHGHLTDWLKSLAARLRRGLGKAARIVLAFDRGGAFPEAMKELRDAGVHFVTYERRPYALLRWTMFEPDGNVAIGKKIYTIYENRLANLGKGRGRVRRIAVLCPDGRQINLLAVSDLPAETLLAIMLGRWKQENAFKHGAERWGINQLDGRRLVEYSPDTVIPNPARRRLDNAIRIARRSEGDARCKLASLPPDDPRRDKYERQLRDALTDQERWKAQRPQAPKHIELQHSELAGELVHHTPDYKGLLDVVRIACANGESELASLLAQELPRPREAKKVLANLFAAPGKVRVDKTTICVSLAPAATNAERKALKNFVEELDGAELSLPGDPARRRLSFEIQT